jgi:hypothetical protein
MSDDTDPLSEPAARAGTGTIDGAVWRTGDPVKHLGPPYAMVARQSPAFYRSKLFQTRCGLGSRYPDGDLMGWRRQGDWGDGQEWHDDDDYWCPACLDQAMIPYQLWPGDDDLPEGGNP